MADAPPLINPYNHLSYLTPEQATQLQVSRYIVLSILGAWCWDFVSSLWEEYTIFRKRIRLPDVGYILARLSTGVFIFSMTFLITLTWSSCQPIRILIGVAGFLAFTLNCLLFLFRIYAIFNGRRFIIGFFTFLWIAVFACTFTAPFAMPTQHVGPTKYCVSQNVWKPGAAGVVAGAVYDTLVFLAITWELSSLVPYDSSRERMKTIVSGAGLGRISKGLLQSGQMYYLLTVGFNICTVALVFITSIPPAYSTFMILPNIALQNAMASRVYRNLKLGYISNTATTFDTTEIPSLRGPMVFTEVWRETDEVHAGHSPFVAQKERSHVESVSDMDVLGMPVVAHAPRSDDSPV
ncbi:hypothetical protein BXZ70DRAFT_961006 [Cristinia sonorae]|uniref:Uncharacterized protein n=1 Tax=Cristinia sonorae TaxID=1940300 RepID=A0A8K0XK74_9AGAR|nr:hypothetical protein BXZ70DRAFT_961006 [Cristinia sonorae]